MITFSYQADTILTFSDKTLRKDKHKTQTSIANCIGERDVRIISQRDLKLQLV